MKISLFFRELVTAFPVLFLTWSGLLLFQGFFAGASLLSIAPIIDILLHPDMKDVSILTDTFVKICNQLYLPTTLTTFVLIFLSFIILKNFFFVVAQYTVLKIMYVVTKDLVQKAFADIFRARWLFFSQARQGTLLNTFNKEVTKVADSLGLMSVFFSNLIQLIVYIAIPIYLSWQIALICFAFAILFVAPFVFLSKLNYRLGSQVTATANELSGALHENFNATKVILGFGKQHQNIKRYFKIFDKHYFVFIRSQLLGTIPSRIYEPLGIIALLLALALANTVSIPLTEVGIVVWGLKNAIPFIGQVVNNRNSITGLLPSYEQVMKLRQRAQQMKQISGARPFTGFKESLLIKQVSFTYPGRKTTLQNINISIPQGKMVAIVGESGSGKSTFIDLLMGFHAPNTGKITIDGIPLEAYDIDSYRSQIGYVPQDPTLFNMSVRDNLLWAKNTATEQEIWETCHLANAKEYIQKLPQGLDTLVGERGVQLSGGQCQRLALARAILRQPELLVLDEATSALDTKSEQLIQKAIENIAKSTTTVVIAHRLSTILHANHIYVLKEGEIAEEGDYEHLIQKKGVFHKMVQLQNLQKIA